jgi:quinol monooxygenase YgiN
MKTQTQGIDPPAGVDRKGTSPQPAAMAAPNAPLANAANRKLYLFARFNARAGREAAVEAAIREVIAATREETGCLAIHFFRSIGDSRLFYIHSRWRDSGAFDLHAKLPHTLRFVERIRTLIDHEFESVRTLRIE